MRTQKQTQTINLYKLKTMKELILDYNTWRCGGDPFEISDKDDYPHKLGEGQTMLLNAKGYMCCLGQFACQLGVPKTDLNGIGEPDEIPSDDTIPFLTYFNNDEGVIRNTEFSKMAVDINDNRRTTPSFKINELKALCIQNGIKLTVINQPIN